MSRFFHDLKVEIKKIVWPTPHTVWKNVGIVVAVIAVVGVCVFGLDEAFTHLLHQFMNVAV
ncbi:MAG TPA: preprotein translocase subunit SecE [Ruminococcaceae bacterium]|nr:preprotein translocase subunit SecE [Oscillospiraceae bacterium]